MTDLLVWLDKAMAERETIVSLRRELHMHPECAFKEYETARLIREALSDIGLPYREVGSGTVADIPAAPGKKASLIALRADIDALPIEEKTDLPFSSVNPGMMHACGHDAHTAMLLGAARLLWLNRDMLPGPVRLIFQPAEENGGGAKSMIEAGVLKDVQAIYCLHVRSNLAAGHFLTKDGFIHASSDGYEININGKSCHGAAPQNGVDAIVIAAHTVLALQELISREIGAWDKAVLTIGKITGGTARNIVCGEVLLQGTLRTLDEALRTKLKTRIGEVSRGVSAMLRGEASVAFTQGYCSCYNDEKQTAHAVKLAQALFGMDAMERLPEASMGSEDFGFYQQRVPGVKLYIGTGCKDDIHTPYFTLDESTLPYGTALLCALSFCRLAKSL